MHVKYEKIKGYRIKKGTYKADNGKRYPIFRGLEVKNIDNEWWSDLKNQWMTSEKFCKLGVDGSNINDNIHSLKQAIRHIKKHKELPKGTKLILVSQFIGYDIFITK